MKIEFALIHVLANDSEGGDLDFMLVPKASLTESHVDFLKAWGRGAPLFDDWHQLEPGTEDIARQFRYMAVNGARTFVGWGQVPTLNANEAVTALYRLVFV